MKCSKFLWWAFGANSWLCKKLGLCLCDSKPDPVPPEPPIPPDPPQPPDPPGPPVTVKVDVCTRSGQKAIAACKIIGCFETREFPARGEPKKNCTIHATGKLMKPRKGIRAGIWDWLAVIWTGWDKSQEQYALEQWFFKCREYFKRGVYIMEGFMFIEDSAPEHKHWQKKAPFLWIQSKKKYALSKPSPRYWELSEKMLRIVKLFRGRHFQPTLVMQKYNERPFVQNINNVKGLKTKEAIPFMRQYVRWYVDLARSVYSRSYDPFLKFTNEFTHNKNSTPYGNERIHEFTYNAIFHREMTDESLSLGIPIWKITVDVSHSEGCAAGVNEWKYAKKDGKWHGYKPEEIDIKRRDPKKCVLMEKHGCGSVASFKIAFEAASAHNFWSSGNAEYLASVDGGTNPVADGLGYKVGGFRWPDKDQWGDACRDMMKRSADGGRTMHVTWAAVEIFSEWKNGVRVWNLYFENPDHTLLDYGYIDIAVAAHDEFYGQP